MEFVKSSEIRKLSLSIRNYLLKKSINSARAEPQWRCLYNLVKNNRLESCFIDFKGSDNSHEALSIKMLAKRGSVLAERESYLIDLHSNLSFAFSSINLTPIYIKGFALSLDDRIPRRLRFYEDVDLIIDPLEAKSYLDLLYSRGYRLKLSAGEIDPLVILKSTGSLNLLCPVSGSSIDIHVKPIWPYFYQIFDYQEMIGESRKTNRINADHMLLPSLVQHTLILLIEGTKDLWFRLDKLLDFYICYFSLSSPEVEEFRGVLCRCKLNKMFEFSNYLLTNILEMDEASLNISSIRRDSFGQISHLITDSWEFKVNQNAPTEPCRTWVHLYLIPSRICYLWRRAVLPTENDLRLYPFLSHAPFLFLVFRPLRIFLNRLSQLVPMRKSEA